MTGTAPRKLPAQKRSQETFDRILEVAGDIVIENGISRLSTNRIADRAGISVGTLYEYFSNKEQILQTIASEFFSLIRTEVTAWATEEKFELSWREFFTEFYSFAMKAESEALKGRLKLMGQPYTYIGTGIEVMTEQEVAHSRWIGQTFAGWFRRLGSTWPINRLEKLAMHIYYLNIGSSFYWQVIDVRDPEVENWQLEAMLALLGNCFEDAP